MNSFFTSYSATLIDGHYIVEAPRLDRWSNRLLAPLTTALGRKVHLEVDKDKNVKFRNVKFRFVEIHSLGVRILSGFGALILSPAVLIGLGMRFSSSHAYYAKKEKEVQENAQSQLERGQKFADTNSIQERIELLGALFDAACQIRNLDLEKESSLIKQLNNHFEVLLGSSLEQSSLFLKKYSHEEVRALKRLLSKLVYCYLQGHETSSTARRSFDFRAWHAQVRSFYYENFAVDHMVDNLTKKKEISRLNLSLNHLQDEMISQEEFTDRTICKAFAGEADKPSNISWLHGTTSSTIVGVVKAHGLLKPGGQLRQDGDLAFAGEHDQGAFGINRENISGTALSGDNVALLYAFGGSIGNSDGLARLCIQKPKEMIEAYINEIWGKDFADNKSIEEIRNHCHYLHMQYTSGDRTLPFHLYNIRRHMRILSTLEPALFQEKMIPYVNKIISKLDKVINLQGKKFEEYRTAACNLKEKMFSPILSLAQGVSATPYTPEERELITDSYPVVFGTSKLKLVEGNKAESKTGETARKLPGFFSIEYVHKGPLRLGQDLPFIFVPKEKIDKTRRYLQGQGVKGVEVLSLGTLRIASSYAAFKAEKLRKKQTYGCQKHATAFSK